MRFVDDVHLKPAAGRRITDVFAEFADLFDATIGCSIDFQDIHNLLALRDALAGVALITRDGGRPLCAVERFGKDACRRGFPHAARTGKEVSVRDFLAL